MPTMHSAGELIAWLERQTNAAGLAATAAMKKRLKGPTVTRIKGEAQKKVPKLFRDLMRTVQIGDKPNGATIEYGGLAVQYTERVHFDDSLRHGGPGGSDRPRTDPRGKPIKWVYRGHRTVGALGAWNLPRKTGGKKWRYKSVSYSSRYPGGRYPMTGQSHFLYGRPNSAYEECWPDEEKRIAFEGVKAFDREMAHG